MNMVSLRDTVWTSNKNERRIRSRKQLTSLFLLLLSSSSTASSHHKSRPTYLYESSTYDSTYCAPEMISNHATPIHDEMSEEEERVLSALARIEETDASSRRRTKTNHHFSRRRSSKNKKRRLPKKEAEANPQERSQKRSYTKESKNHQLRPKEVKKANASELNPEIERGPQIQKETTRGPTAAALMVPPHHSKKRASDLPMSSTAWRVPRRQRSEDLSHLPQQAQALRPSLRASGARSVHRTAKPIGASISAARRASASSQSQSARRTSTPSTKEQSSTTTPWIRKFLASRPKDILLPVPKEYISDGFNLAQLPPIIERIGFQAMGENAVDVAKQLVELPQHQQTSYPVYRLALQLILNEEDDCSSILQHPLIPPHSILQAAEALYLLIHARFVASPRGLDALRRILESSPIFGRCPRVSCRSTALLPYGGSIDYTSNLHKNKRSNLCQRYCPCCGEVWNCWDSKTDGCAWGPSLCHLLLLAHGTDIYAPTPATSTISSTIMPISQTTRPMVMGFQIHPATTWGRPLNQQAMIAKKK